MTTHIVTVGRVVHYYSAASGEPRAAIVTAVHQDESVNLAVFPRSGSDAISGPIDDVRFGVAPGERVWCWPPLAPRLPSPVEASRDELPEAPQTRVMKPVRTPGGVAVAVEVRGGKK